VPGRRYNEEGCAVKSPASIKVHVIGPSGAGKTTLARELGTRLGLPVYPLDPIAFTDTRWTIRPLTEKMKAVRDILQQPGWIVEGGHVGWTEPLLDAADVIIWLEISLPTTIRRRTRGLRGRQLFFEAPQMWWQVRWYLRRYRTNQDVDRLPSASAIRHFLKRRMDKVRRYRSNPPVDVVEAMIRAG
jgi:adenylate kinase family enzyme